LRGKADDGDAARFRDIYRRRIEAGLDKERPGAQVPEIVLKFVRATGGIEWYANRAGCNGQERYGHLRTIGKHNRDTIVPAQSDFIEPSDRVFNLRK